MALPIAWPTDSRTAAWTVPRIVHPMDHSMVLPIDQLMASKTAELRALQTVRQTELPIF
jgi:hypothetical protein